MQSTSIRQRSIFVIVGVLVVFAGVYFLLNLGIERLPQGGARVLLYYYNPALDQGPGGIQCSEKGLVAVERIIPRSENLLQEAVQLLIEGRLLSGERDQGITTEFPLTEFTLQSANVRDGIATLVFLDPQNKTIGGSCRVSVLRAQIEATAKQFPHVREVRIEPVDLFQP